ncbi:hypothetical protein E4T42_04965 [Aureobasidium subglaciale]|nr:hypothetical protein E4T42_04965 [Aureobasidium subglaciale]
MAASVDFSTVIVPSEGLPTPPSHILALPHELLSMIVSECDPNDLKNVRLTFKLMHAISIKHFGRKKFSRRRFVFTFESMKALLDITAHPVFGPGLKCITFGTYRMAPWNDCEIEDEHSDDPNVLHDQIDYKHQKFIHCNDHVKMLVLSLENLTRCGNTEVVLGIHDDIHGIEVRRPGYAFKASYRGYPLKIVDPRETIDAVTEAASRSKYAIKALKLCLSSSSYSLRNLVGSERDVLHEILSAKKQLRERQGRKMDLHLNVWLSQSYTKMKILSNATRLELSRSSFNRAIFDQLSHGELWDTVSSTALDTIVIRNSAGGYDEFTDFLRRHKRSLTTFELEGFDFLLDEFPTALLALRFLRFLKSDFQLSCLSMEKLTVRETLEVPDSGRVVYHGAKQVDEGLQSLIEEAEEMYGDESVVLKEAYEQDGLTWS